MRAQTSLFGDEPAAAPGAVVRIATVDGSARLSKDQQAFNRLIEKIGRQREELARWQAFLPEFQRRVVEDLEPVQRRMAALDLDKMRRFDAAHSRPETTKGERKKLSWLICELAQDLLSRAEDPAVVALHDKHSDISYEESKEEDADFLKAMAEGVFGMDLDEAGDMSSPEAVLEAMSARIEQDRAKSADQASQARQRPQSAKAQARQAREAAQAQGATQSVREVFRKLASALHPDREPDPEERARKTALMQRVNQAYEANDLLQLLELQIQIEQIDPARLGAIDDKRLAHYVRVLKEQSQELAQELNSLVTPFAMQVPYRRDRTVTPQDVLAALQVDVAALRREAQQLRREIEAFADLRQLKAWLKQVRIRKESDDDVFDAIGAEIFAAMRSPGRRRR